MTNHPNRSSASFRFIAFSMIHQSSVAHATTAAEALRLATERLPDTRFIEILDCGANGRKVWTGGGDPANPVPLYKARHLHQTVFRGDGYADDHAPIALAQ